MQAGHSGSILAIAYQQYIPVAHGIGLEPGTIDG